MNPSEDRLLRSRLSRATVKSVPSAALAASARMCRKPRLVAAPTFPETRMPASIDLIDGEQLCLLLKEKGLGVVSETVERVTPDREFFDAL